MPIDRTLLEINRALKQRGGPAMTNARESMLQHFKDESACSQALRYFSKVTLRNALPVFPALLSMACEAVGGKPEKTTPFGEAIVFISAAADLHDDVIDQSLEKGSKQTVSGKFGDNVAILAGDILLVEGLRKLYEASEALPKRQAREVSRLVSEAVFEICTAEAIETQLHEKDCSTIDAYEEMIRCKAVVPEVSMKIGAIIGNGDAKEVTSLGEFGRIYGINSIIIEEFIDLLNFEEFKNRLRNECPPLPVIYAIKNPQTKAEFFSLLNPEVDESTYKKIIDMILDLKEMEVIYENLTRNVENEQNRFSKSINVKIREELMNMLVVPLKSFEV